MTGPIAPGARRTDLSETNNSNNLHCQNAACAAVGIVGVSGAVSEHLSMKRRFLQDLRSGRRKTHPAPSYWLWCAF
jgi:hypothetical protein